MILKWEWTDSWKVRLSMPANMEGSDKAQNHGLELLIDLGSFQTQLVTLEAGVGGLGPEAAGLLLPSFPATGF